MRALFKGLAAVGHGVGTLELYTPELIGGKVTNRLVEAKIILLLWLVSASAVCYSVVGNALSLAASTAAYADSAHPPYLNVSGIKSFEEQPISDEDGAKHERG